MKKLVLLGAAGLAALSISCSDDPEDGAGGSFTQSFNVVDGTYLVASGQITADGENEVKAVVITVGGTPVNIQNAPSVPTKVYSLNHNLIGVCGTSSGNQTFTFVITATFTDNTTISDTKSNVPVNCGGGIQIHTQTFTLSSGNGTTEFSYRDLDEEESYKQNDAIPGRVGEIDLIAFASADFGNKIWSAESVEPFDDADDYSIIWDIPDNQQAAALAALNSSDPSIIGGFAGGKDLIMTNDNRKQAGLDISNNRAFLVESTEMDIFAVIITGSNIPASGTKTVTLKAISF